MGMGKYIAGCMLGLMVGDALGAPFEGCSREQVRRICQRCPSGNLLQHSDKKVGLPGSPTQHNLSRALACAIQISLFMRSVLLQ
eukprot:6324025-Amphidinium_carterae.1